MYSNSRRTSRTSARFSAQAPGAPPPREKERGVRRHRATRARVNSLTSHVLPVVCSIPIPPGTIWITPCLFSRHAPPGPSSLRRPSRSCSGIARASSSGCTHVPSRRSRRPAAGADAALAIAGGASQPACARALDACAVAAAGALALWPGRSPVRRLAHAHAARRVAGAVPVAAVHASAVRPAVGAAGAVRIALTRPRQRPRPRHGARPAAPGRTPRAQSAPDHPVVTRAEAAHPSQTPWLRSRSRSARGAPRRAGEVRLAPPWHLRAADAAAI